MKREQFNWGVRLSTQPFTGANSGMFVQAEITGSTIKVYFSGTTVRHPLKRADTLTWLESLRAVFDAAIAETRQNR